MRGAFYQYLMANCQTVPTWTQPYMATKDTPKPYGVIVIGEVMRSPGNHQGFFRDVQIWPYFGGASFVAVDKAVKEIRRLLSGVTLSTSEGNRFEIEWVDEGRDYRDPDLEALTRRIDFRIPLVGGGL